MYLREVAAVPTTSPKVTRGIRNNNPGNIRIGLPWQGLMPEDKKNIEQKREDAFCVFDAPVWGIRAIAKILQTYGRTRRAADGSRIDTVREVITRWAPPSENKTDEYAAYVARMMRLPGPDEKIDMEDFQTQLNMVKAIIRFENNGRCPYDDNLIRQALDYAGIRPPRATA